MNSRKRMSRMLAEAARLSVLFTGVLASGCGQEFDPPSLIDKVRPLGAQVQVDGDPSRSTPRPGETAIVSWIMAAPGEMPPLAWAFVICRSGAASEAPDCAPAPFAVAEGTGAPSFTVTIPPPEMLGSTNRLLVFGQICVGSIPALDPQTQLPSCGTEGTTAKLSLDVQTSDEGNRSPALGERPFWFDGVDWAADGQGEDCATMPNVALGSKDHVVHLRVLAEDRETFTAVSNDGTARPSRETLQVSQFVTAGKLDHTYSVVESSNQEEWNDLEVTWDAPEVLPVDGRVHFIFVARDLRGGVGYTTRTVCVQ